MERQLTLSSSSERTERTSAGASGWTYALLAGLLYFIIASSFFYGGLNKGATALGLPSAMCPQGPSIFGLLLGTVIFILVAKLIFF